MTFSSVMEYTIICSLTTCRVTAADDLMTFPQLCLGLKAVSSTSTPCAALWFGPASQLRRLPSRNNSINVRRKASDCRSRPGRVVRRRASTELVRFSGGTYMFLPSAQNTCRSTTARPRRHSKTSTALVLSRLDYCNAVLAGLPASTLAPFQ